MSVLPRDIDRATAGAGDLHRRSSPARVSSRLWLCVVLPELALSAVAEPPDGRRRTGDHAVAISEGEGGSGIVYCCNSHARAAGIQPGMKLGAALALVPQLQLYPRNPAAESALLNSLARRAIRYTPVVCIGDDALFLEVAGSLLLFDGLDALEARVRADFQAQGLQVVISTSGSATAALWLARAGLEVSCLTREELQHQLSGVL